MKLEYKLLLFLFILFLLALALAVYLMTPTPAQAHGFAYALYFPVERADVRVLLCPPNIPGYLPPPCAPHWP